MNVEGCVKLRSSAPSFRGGAPGESVIHQLNPQREKKILAETGWRRLEPGSLNLCVDDETVDSVKGGTKLDQVAEENQTTWPLGRVSESGWAAGLERSLGTPVGGPRRSGSPVAQPAAQEGGGVRTRERQRRGGLSCCVGADSCRRSVPGCGRDGSAGRAARRSAVQSQRSRSIR